MCWGLQSWPRYPAGLGLIPRRPRGLDGSKEHSVDVLDRPALQGVLAEAIVVISVGLSPLALCHHLLSDKRRTESTPDREDKLHRRLGQRLDAPPTVSVQRPAPPSSR